MRIDYHVKNIELTETFKRFVEKRLSRFNRYLHEDAVIRLHFEQARSNAQVEGILHDNGDIFTAKGQGHNISEAFMDLLNRLRKQLKKNQKKMKSNRRREARVTPETLIAEPSIPEKKTLEKASKEDFTPMTLEEATTWLEKTQKNFIIFRDPKEGTLRILFIQDNGALCLVNPYDL